MAFQMADDLLDYTSNFKDSGKKPGADLREGKLTLPVIYAMREARLNNKSEDVKILEETIRKQDTITTDDFICFNHLLAKYGGIEYTLRMAEEQVRKAKGALDCFPMSNEKNILGDLADYTLLRKT